MKRIYSLFILALVAISSFAYDVEVDGIYYNLVSKTKEASVTYGSNRYSGSVTIPSTITVDGVSYSVTSIRYDAFYCCSGLISITIPNSVTSIGNDAFRGCSDLTFVRIPNSVTSIGERAFYSCSGLTSITIGNSVTSIGYNAFSQCSGLTSVTIPNSVKGIGDGAFYDCSGLTSITIGNSVTIIGTSAFEKCSGLTSVTIPNSVTSIGDAAFSGCSGLTSITIPNSITYIGSYAFEKCSRLTSVTIPNSVTSIGGCAFDGCSSLTTFEVDNDNPNYCAIDNVFFNKNKTELLFCIATKTGSYTIPNSVTSIEYHAFYGCSGLTSITIPNSVTRIGYWAFRDCSGLTSITIPNSVTSIGEWAFAGCSAIKKIYWNTNISYTFGSFVEEIYYGDDVTTVYPLVYYINNLNKVVLGKNVEYIRTDAFKGANLKEFYITGEKVPYLYPGVFTNVTLSNCTLYVPSTKTDYYQTTEPWKNFGKILMLDGGDPGGVQKKCAAPCIVYNDGHLKFSSTTPNATYSYILTDNDIKTSLTKSTTGDIPLSTAYNITVYAEAEGYDVSEPTTKTLQFGGNSVSEDVDALKAQIKSLQAQNEALESENATLKETIKKYAEGDLNLDGRTNIDDVVYLLKIDSYSSDDGALALLLDGTTAITLTEISDKYGDVEFYTLNGVKVDVPTKSGIYIVKKNGVTKMVVVKK